jgi:Cof subfamily protein (haloacid dehalogenase superfamily)
MSAQRRKASSIRLLLADVDGTLVTNDKRLTKRAIAAARRLHEAGIGFAITSGRPPRGMAMLIEPLQLTTPIAAFNGGLIVDSALTVLEERAVAAELVPEIVATLESFALDAWLYRGTEWYVRDRKAPHVDREAWTVKFEPTLVADFSSLAKGVVKIVGVSDDPAAIKAATDDVHERFGDHISAARSQPYYLDVTHPDANKGAVARYMTRSFGIRREQLATIGDMPNDVLMFAHSGLSIAMGNADREVQRAARRVTASNEQEGFALAVERFILGESY